MSDYRKFDAALQSAGVCYKTDEPMSAHTSLRSAARRIGLSK